MGRSPRCSKDGLNKGAWTADEDKSLTDYIKIHGEGKWSNVAKQTGLPRCGKSCRLRWMNYLRPNIKRGNISHDEEELIIRLHKLLGNRWSLIAGRLPGRTDNEIKNYWNTNLAKKATTELSVHSIKEKKNKLRHLHEQEQEHEHEPNPASNTADKANSLPGTNNVFVASEEYKAQMQNHNNNNKVDQLLPPHVEGNWQKHKNYETDQSSDGSPSSMSREENSSEFMIDFNMDDFCRILYSDFAKLNGEQGDGNDINNGCKSEASPDDFGDQKKEEKYWRSSADSEGVVQNDMSSEFLSLASSFLESAADQEWPGDDLNIAHAHVH